MEDEIDLMDYVKVILKRKLFILSLFLAAVIVAAIFSFLSPKIYKIDTVLEIGKIGGETVESPKQLMGRIEGDVYGALIRTKLDIPEIEYPIIKVENPEDTSVIKMEIESSDTEKSEKVLDEKNELIVTEHQGKIELGKELLRKRIELLEEDIKVSQKDIERTEIKIVSLGQEQSSLEEKVDALEGILIYQQDPGTQFALFDTKEKLEAKKQEIENRYLQINALEKQINDLKNQINSLENQIENIQPTLIIKDPTVSEKPISPRPLLNMAIAGILGLFIGTFLAFGREWWEKAK
ncbi:MAG: Wzz/FepE/Etk N-terminal domain-containing protein [Candidatus Paceibacterota bacterium]|jgi:capsular polysaccharide biosynthesis protein